MISSGVLTEVIKVTQVAQSVIQSEATEFSLSGEAQTFTFSIQSNTDVQVSVSAEWIQFTLSMLYLPSFMETIQPPLRWDTTVMASPL